MKPASKCKKPFEVAQVTGRDGKTRWAIPSHFDYPADAKDHLAEAASLLMGIKSVNTAPGMDDEHGDLDQDNIRRLHNEYGVVDPDPATVKSSDTGVGTRITLKNKEGKTLASLIVGKQVGEQGNQRYVRYPDKDAVYIVDIDPSKVSTKFEDWIERNLLGMNTMDLKQVHIQDYSIVPAEDGLHGYRKARGRVPPGLRFQRHAGLEADQGPGLRCGQEGAGSAGSRARMKRSTPRSSMT